MFQMLLQLYLLLNNGEYKCKLSTNKYDPESTSLGSGFSAITSMTLIL